MDGRIARMFYSLCVSILSLSLLILLLAAPEPALPGTGGSNGAAPIHGCRIVNTYPHDHKAFTQGLVFHDGFFYEGTGLYGRSTLRKVRLETGSIVRKIELPDNVFGEGVTLRLGRLIQLTWRNEIGYIYDETSFRVIRRFRYRGEGWGITQDGHYIIMSDGSAVLRFLDPETLTEKRKVEVRDGPKPVANLNELEYIKGEIYANIFNTDRIARISPKTGRVLSWIDLSGLRAGGGTWQQADVLNGIAYDERHDRIFVTGKFWPKIFEITAIPQTPRGNAPGGIRK